MSLPLFHVLLALAVVIAAGRLLGLLFRRLHQPPVIGEVVAGILLGPSLLGWLWPQAQQFLFPHSVVPHLGILAQIGIVFYMFLVGLELNGELLRDRASSLLVIALAGIAVPFALGVGLAFGLPAWLVSTRHPFTAFALFLGVSLAVTAFPVLARILTDRGIDKTPLGMCALSCAAVGDVAAWCLLAFVVGVVKADYDGALLVIVLSLAFIALLLCVVKPLVAGWVRKTNDAPLPRGAIALVILGVLLAAAATEGIGIHALFGAFLFGAIIPHDSKLAQELTGKLESVVTILLLPAFFAYTGLHTEIGLVEGWEAWLIVAVIILVATLGKFGGTLLAARWTGHDWRTASALGILMNTRGLMELIVLNVGLELKVISRPLFAMMVLMALVTTLATTPLLQLLNHKQLAR